jgi:hypothetical protein
VNVRLNRNELEELRDAKYSRNFYRFESSTHVEHEFRHPHFGHPSTYAFVRFACDPADDLSFEARASWPSTVPADYRLELERAIAEAVADVLLEGLYQHTGCAVTLIEIRYDEICSSVASFMWATKSAMQELLTRQWKVVIRNKEASDSSLA